jgi:uncharacterized protein YdeI (YjbR/CyaY-like superfamily)
MGVVPAPELPQLAFATVAEFESWLEEHHAAEPGCWVMIAKKGTGAVSISYEESVESAVCFGWIDGQTRRVDEIYYALRFTPRRPRSPWSASNVARVERLTAAGRMRPSGTAQVVAAQADGRWPSTDG